MSEIAATSARTADTASIPSNYSRLIARELGLQVRDLPGLQQGTGLTTAQLLDEEQMLTASQQARIVQNAVALSADPAFGLRLGRRLTPFTHGPVGLLAHSSPDLRTALEAVCLYLPTRMSLLRLELAEDQNSLNCLCSFQAGLRADVLRALADTLATIFFEFAEFIVGRPVAETRIQFPYPKPEDSGRYTEALHGSLEFGAEQFSLSLPLSVVEIPNASANRQSYELALKQCETMLAQLTGNQDSFEFKVQKLMLSQPLGMLTETEAAATLFMTKRTLARRLKAEGTGFRQIRDDILSRQAASYLTESELSVEAIASLLNYHDAANFRRAFKRWYGMPPDAYRGSNRVG